MTKQREAVRYYTVRDVADYYGVTEKIVRRWILSGDLPSSRGPWMKTRWGFTRPDLDAMEATWAARKVAS